MKFQASVPIKGGKTVNDLYIEKGETGQPGNSIKSDGGLIINFPDEKPLHDFKVVEKNEPIEEQIEKIEEKQPTVEKEIVSEILHQHEFDEPDEPVMEEIVPPVKEKPVSKKPDEPLELEIKAVPDKVVEEEASVVENLPPYEPTLDLRRLQIPDTDFTRNAW